MSWHDEPKNRLVSIGANAARIAQQHHAPDPYHGLAFSRWLLRAGDDER